MSAPARLHSVPPSFADAFGQRQLVFDQTAGTSLEVLKFADPFAKSPEFETALRERIDALKHVHHPSLGTVHRVERDGEALLLLSKHTPGRRVVELQAKAQGASFALELIRLVTPLLATLEKAGPGMSHGAISADRIVVTRDGRLVVVEHVLGSAINALKFSRPQLAEIGVIVPAGLPGSDPARPVLDSRADIAQLAFLALSLLLGRPLQASEYPDKVAGLLDEFVMAAGSPMLAAKLRSWLERAMQLSPKAFASAAEATEATKDLPDDLDVKISNSLSAFPSEAVAPSSRPGPKAADRQAPPTPKAHVAALPDSPAPQRTAAPKRVLAGWLAAGLAVIAIGEGIALFVWPYLRPASEVIEVRPAASANPAPAPVVPDPAAAVAPPVGPATNPAAPAPQTQQANLGALPAPAPAPPPAAATIPVKTEPAAAAPADTPGQARFGGVTVSSPLDLQIFESGKLLGTNFGQVALSEGSHALEFINEATGFRYTQSVSVRAGKMTTVSIAVPKGRLSINAVPWADVLIDGTAAGQTPIANFSLPIGTHEIVFRHPQFGEKKQTVVVKVEGLTKVTQTLQSGGGNQ